MAKKAVKKKAVKSKGKVPKTGTATPIKKKHSRTFSVPPDCYSTHELAKQENVHYKTILHWIVNKKIKCKKDAKTGQWLIPKKTFKRPTGYSKVA